MKIQEYTSLEELKKDLIKSNNIKRTDTEFKITVCQNIYDKIQEALHQEFIIEILKLIFKEKQ